MTSPVQGTSFPDFSGSEGRDWDRLLINGIPVPGAVSVSVTTGGGIEAAKGTGLAGAFTRDNGRPPAKVKIRIKLVTPEDCQRWGDVATAFVGARLTTARKPVEAIHPAINVAGFSLIIVDTCAIESPEGAGFIVVNVDALEFLKAKPVVKRTLITPTISDRESGQTTTIVEPTDSPRRFTF